MRRRVLVTKRVLCYVLLNIIYFVVTSSPLRGNARARAFYARARAIGESKCESVRMVIAQRCCSQVSSLVLGMPGCMAREARYACLSFRI